MSTLSVDNLQTNSKVTLPSYTNATRPATPITGTLIFNTSVNRVQAYNGVAWKNVG